jgi:hypothetical protein
VSLGAFFVRRLDVDQTETISTKDIAFINNDQGAATLSMQSIISFRL